MPNKERKDNLKVKVATQFHRFGHKNLLSKAELIIVVYYLSAIQYMYKPRMVKLAA